MAEDPRRWRPNLLTATGMQPSYVFCIEKYVHTLKSSANEAFRLSSKLAIEFLRSVEIYGELRVGEVGQSRFSNRNLILLARYECQRDCEW